MWMNVKLNDEKTEVILLRDNNIKKHIPSPSLHIDAIFPEKRIRLKTLASPSIIIFLYPLLSVFSVKILMFHLQKMPALEID